jgi:hypothetical protein
MQPNNPVNTVSKTRRPADLGPNQKAWCDEHLPHFRVYRRGAEEVIASTEESRRKYALTEKADA